MPESQSLIDRAQELVDRYRQVSRELELEDAARASSVLGQMLVEVERASRMRSAAAARLAEEAIAAATRLLQPLDPRD